MGCTMFVNLAKDVLIFTDRSQSAGGIATGERRAVGITSGMYTLLQHLYFGEQPAAPAVDDFIPREPRVRSSRTAEALPEMLQQFSDETGIFSIDKAPASLGEITSSEHLVDDVVQLNGDDVWCPAGTSRSRKVGDFKLISAVSIMDVSSATKKDSLPQIVVAHVDRVPRLISRSSECGACGVCGVCGICGSANAASAAVAAAALAALY